MFDGFIIIACLIITGLSVALLIVALMLYDEAKYITQLAEKQYKHRKR